MRGTKNALLCSSAKQDATGAWNATAIQFFSGKGFPLWARGKSLLHFCEWETSDWGKTYAMTIRLVSPSGPMPGETVIHIIIPQGVTATQSALLPMPDIMFSENGEHFIEIEIADTAPYRVPLQVTVISESDK